MYSTEDYDDGRPAYYFVDATWNTTYLGDDLEEPYTETVSLFLHDPSDEDEVLYVFNEMTDFDQVPDVIHVGEIDTASTFQHYTDPDNFIDV